MEFNKTACVSIADRCMRTLDAYRFVQFSNISTNIKIILIFFPKISHPKLFFFKIARVSNNQKLHFRTIFSGNTKSANRYSVIYVRIGSKVEIRYEPTWIMCMSRDRKRAKFVEKFRRIVKHCESIKPFIWNHGRIVSNVSSVDVVFVTAQNSK